MRNQKIVILGAGLAGLSCGYFLSKAGKDFVIYEKESRAGGLCKTEMCKEVPCDYGVHVIWRKPEWWGNFIEQELNIPLNWMERKASVYFENFLIPYPFQANLEYLSKQNMFDAIISFFKRIEFTPENFHDWCYSNFGFWLSEHFFVPFNEKLLKYNLRNISLEAVKNIPKISNYEMLENLFFNKEKRYGGNVVLGYPKEGGIEEIIKPLVEKVKDKIIYNKTVIKIIPEEKTVVFEDGEKITYDILVSSIPLSIFSLDLQNSLVWILCVEGENNLKENHWVYFPERNIEFYRINFLDSINLKNKNTSLIEYSTDVKDIVQSLNNNFKVINDLERIGFKNIKIIGKFLVSPGYVRFTFESEKIKENIKKRCNENNIKLIGRYGKWCYESMHESFEDGKNIAEEIINL